MLAHRRRAAVILAALIILSACASKAPPQLEPGALPIWQANEIQIAFGALQRSAIALNAVTRCDTAQPPVCMPLLSDANTRVVIDGTADVVKTLRAVPAGWKATALEGLDRITTRLDAAGKTKLASYLSVISSVAGSL